MIPAHAGRIATLAAVLLSGLFTAAPAVHAAGMSAAPDPASCPDRVALVNAGFEQPVLTSSWGFFPDASQAQSPNRVPGWLTTATDHQIEIWKSGAFGVVGAEGGQFAELNANQVSTLYQDLPTTPGAQLYWRLSHRGRAGQDTMALDIGAPGAGVEQRRMTDGTAAWGRYSGVYTVPTGQTVTRFAFRSVSAAGGNQSIGNFLDGIFFGTPPCVVVTKTAAPAGPVDVGDIVTYRLTAKNGGGGAAENVTLTDAIPAGTSYVPGSLKVVDGPNTGAKTDQTGDDQAYADTSAGRVVFHLGNGASATSGGNLPSTAQVPDGTTVEFRVRVDLSGAGTQLSNKGTVSYENRLGATPEQLVSTSNEALTKVNPAADLKVVKSADLTKVTVGQTVVYRVRVTNDGPNDATGVIVDDALPANLRFISAHASIGSYDPATQKWTVGGLAKGKSAVLRIRAKAATVAETVNKANAHGNELDPDKANNTDSVEICVQPGSCTTCQTRTWT